jgi:hypothetical protein
MTAPDYIRSPWTQQDPASAASVSAHHASAIPVVPIAEQPPQLDSPMQPVVTDPPPAGSGEALSDEHYRIVDDLCDQVSTRLTIEDQNYPPGPRRVDEEVDPRRVQPVAVA